MKKYSLFLLILSMGLLVTAQHTLVNKSQNQTQIVIARDADSLSLKAASELQYYLLEMSGVQIPIVHEADKVHSVFIGRNFLTEQQTNRLSSASEEESFIIHTDENALFLAGMEPMGDLYAVYTLLEEYLDCMFYTVDEKFIPAKNTIVVDNISKLYEPAFPFRVPHFEGRWDQDFSRWHKISSFDQWGMFVHTFHKLIPPELYFDEYPEYFALVDGRRLKDGQLCLSNAGLMQLLIARLGEEIDKQPEKKYWSVSQNDCYNYCECNECEKLYETYGSISGAYVDMSNQIAKVFPDKQISTLAYQFTRSAPTHIKPHDNVNIMFCSIECNRSQPLTEDPRSQGFVKEMKDWSKLTDNIFAWDYVVQFKNYLCPFPNFHVLQSNIQFFKEHGVNMMFQQGSGGSWSDLSDVKQYLIAKLLWNPDLNADSVVNHFMSSYYGKAAPFVRAYFKMSHGALIACQETQNLDIYGFPVFYVNAHLTPELLIEYQTYMDKAEDAVADDSTYLLRVLKTRLAIDFAFLDVALNHKSDVLSWITDENGKSAISQEMLTKLDRLVEIAELTGVETINERRFKPEAYQDFTIRKLQWQIKDNLLKDAHMQLEYEASHKYPVGGVKALTDGLLGGLDYRFNWMGFEGEDMILSIDLKKEIRINKLQMNFLKAVNSWIFLPEQIVLEVSEDGVNYRQIAVLEGDNSDRHYLVKSIPCIFDIPNTKTRYLRLKAISMKTNPEWHRGFGRPSWIFIDELIAE